MKRKHLITTLFVSLATTFGVLAGTLINKEVKAVKAVPGDTTVFFVTFDAGTIPSDWRDQCSNFRIYFWCSGEGAPSPREYNMHKLGIEDIYTANVSFNETNFIPAGYQLRFEQGTATKYSTDMPGSDFDAWPDHAKHYRFGFSGSWYGDNWGVTLNKSTDRISFTTPNGTTDFSINQAPSEYFFVEVNNAVTDFDYSYDLKFDSAFTSSHDYVYSLIFNKDLVTPGNANNTFRFKEAGSYHVYITNNSKTGLFDDEYSTGIVQIKKTLSFNDPENFGYLYYVSENSYEEGEGYADIMMYTFLGAQANGDFPGTYMGAYGEDVVDCVFGFKFQNKQTYCKVYRVRYSFGYPNGLDEYVIFSYPKEGQNVKTADLLLQDRAAYWRNTAYHTCNYEAGAALDVIYDLQAVLEEVSDYVYEETTLQNSVCAISQSEAARLYRRYIALPLSVRQTYVDASYINTYNTPDPSSKNYISAYDIFTLLGQRGGVIGNSRINLLASLSANDASTIAVIVVLAIISTASVGAFFTLKKRKHN